MISNKVQDLDFYNQQLFVLLELNSNVVIDNQITQDRPYNNALLNIHESGAINNIEQIYNSNSHIYRSRYNNQ